MDTKSILFLTFSAVGILGLGSYFLMSDYNRKQAFNMDTYGNPQGDVELPYVRRPAVNDGSTFGGKRTKNNRKRHRKNSKKK